MRQPKVEKAFENLCHAVRWAGIDTEGLSFNTGSKTNGISYRIYITPGHTDWPYAPPGGYLGMTAAEAIRTLDTMRYVFQGMAIARTVSYPRKNENGETVWACCESSIGPVCNHRRESV